MIRLGLIGDNIIKIIDDTVTFLAPLQMEH